MQRFFGGKVLKMTWNRDKKSWKGEAVKLSNALACTRFRGKVLKMTWNRDKKSWKGKAVKLRMLWHVIVLGGKF